MTDNELFQWLSVEEQGAWSMLRREPGGEASWAIRSLRSLAETRKALAIHDPASPSTDCHTTLCYCRVCADETPHRHKPDCIFATMPRPQAHVAGGRINE